MKNRPTVAGERQKIKTILFVSHTASLYGSERSLLSLANGLTVGGNFKALVLTPKHGPLIEELTAANIPVVSANYYHWIGRSTLNRAFFGPIRFVLNLIAIPGIRRLIKRNSVALIYSNTLASPFGALLARATGLPHVWHAREFIHEDMDRDFDNFVRPKHWLNQAQALICNSESVRNKWVNIVDDAKASVIYNGFAFGAMPTETGAQRFERCVKSSPTVKLVMVGGIRPKKGQEDAIRSLAQLKGRNSKITLEFIGSGSSDYVSYLKELARQLNVIDLISWHGFVRIPDPFLTDAAAALVCSRHEAFGRVAVEAMSMGIPVIGTNSGGIPEIITDGETGLLYTPRDIDTLTQGIHSLLNDADTYARISESGAQSVRARFSMPRYIDGISRILENSLDPGKHYVQPKSTLASVAPSKE